MATNNYWIKLYHEILDDPKMGLLPDHLWRRTIELFLLAGKLDQEGDLPDTPELAWLLRQPDPQALQAELEHLARLTILTRLPQGWRVTHFARRQAAIPPEERMRSYRDRKRHQAVSSSSEFPVQNSELNSEPGTPHSELSPAPAPSLSSRSSISSPVTTRNPDTDKDIDIDKDLLSNDNSGFSPHQAGQFQEKCDSSSQTPSLSSELNPELSPTDHASRPPSPPLLPGSLSVPPSPQPPGPPSPNPERVEGQYSLTPDTPETEFLFTRINHNRHLRNRRAVQLFQSLEQKQKCLAAAGRLGYPGFEAALTTGLEKGLTDLGSLVNWIAKWETNGGTNDRCKAYQPRYTGFGRTYQPAYQPVARATGLGEWTEEEKRELGFA